ncbi:hypothetical protein GCM10009131_00360 [Morganella psychrotolerans]
MLTKYFIKIFNFEFYRHALYPFRINVDVRFVNRLSSLKKNVIYPNTRDNADNPLIMRINQNSPGYLYLKEV